jgi:hypothetical protein
MNPLSHLAIHLATFKGNVPLGRATGMLYRDGERVWLVTAGHVITGLNADTAQPLQGSGAIPDRLVAKAMTIGPKHEETHARELQWRDVEISLYDAHYNARWIGHPKGIEWDVAAVEVTTCDAFPGDHLCVNDDLPEYHDFDVEAGDDAFVLGYPRGLTGGGQLPVWKRATVASEPNAFSTATVLIDTATREGMSGAPVIARRSGWVQKREGDVSRAIVGQANSFLGVYTGRVLADEDTFLAQLGKVFKGPNIRFLVNAESYGAVL